MPPAGWRSPRLQLRCTTPAQTSCSSVPLPVWSHQRPSGGCGGDEEEAVCISSRHHPKHTHICGLLHKPRRPVTQPAGQMSPWLTQSCTQWFYCWRRSRGWSGGTRRTHGQRIYCCCPHCWESLGNSCIISSAFNLLGKQAWDDGKEVVEGGASVPQRCDPPHWEEKTIPARLDPAKWGGGGTERTSLLGRRRSHCGCCVLDLGNISCVNEGLLWQKTPQICNYQRIQDSSFHGLISCRFASGFN